MFLYQGMVVLFSHIFGRVYFHFGTNSMIGIWAQKAKLDGNESILNNACLILPKFPGELLDSEKELKVNCQQFHARSGTLSEVSLQHMGLLFGLQNYDHCVGWVSLGMGIGDS